MMEPQHTTVALEETAIRELVSGLRGTLLRPGEAGYRDNYARLAQIKARYDPGNLFHVNQNIKPTR